jgi:hypothetical protein
VRPTLLHNSVNTWLPSAQCLHAGFHGVNFGEGPASFSLEAPEFVADTLSDGVLARPASPISADGIRILRLCGAGERERRSFSGDSE